MLLIVKPYKKWILNWQKMKEDNPYNEVFVSQFYSSASLLHSLDRFNLRTQTSPLDQKLSWDKHVKHTPQHSLEPGATLYRVLSVTSHKILKFEQIWNSITPSQHLAYIQNKNTWEPSMFRLPVGDKKLGTLWESIHDKCLRAHEMLKSKWSSERQGTTACNIACYRHNIPLICNNI